jgi:tetratricopeptide (TPR) repeat protein
MRRFAAILAALVFSGCSRHAPPEFQRIAVLRFENLGADASTDWIGRAFSEIITSELASAPGMYAIPSTRIHSYERAMGARPVSAPGISAERGLAIVAGANRLGYGSYAVSGGKLHASLTIADPRNGKTTAVFSAVAAQGDVIGAATALARRLWAAAPAYRSSNAPALKSYISALEGNDPAAVVRDLEGAIAASPDFASAYRLLAQLKAQAHDAPGALDVIGRALSTDLRPLERARLEVAEAELRGDRGLRLRALDTVSKLTPSDPTVWQALAEARFNAHDYSRSAGDYGKAIEIEPQDVNVLNQMGYSCAYAGDLAAAMAALRRYQVLRPADANPLDSMGDVNLVAGRLADAENFYLQASRKVPHFELDVSLFKAAMARLMTGDIAGADVLAQRYLDARAAEKDLAVDYRKAEWLWISGRRKDAVARMQAFAHAAGSGPSRELAGNAYASLALWKLLLGDRAASLDFVRQAEASAPPRGDETVALARFLAAPSAPSEEWAARAERDFPGPAANNFRDLAIAYASLLEKRFQAASDALQRVFNSGETGDSQGVLPVLLAWTYLETGRDKDAAPLLRWNPIPASINPLFSFCFPRVFYLRALSASRAGKRDEAAADYQLFRRLSGADPLVWSEERQPQ